MQTYIKPFIVFIVAAVVIYVLTSRKIMQDVQVCSSLAEDTVPDMMMYGYSENKLNSLYEAWGNTGRDAYVRMANTDLFPVVESYTVVLGACLVVAGRRFRWKDDKVAYLALVTMALDVFETLVHRRGSLMYPEKLSGLTIALGSLATQAKWLFFTGSMMLVALSFVFGQKTERRRHRKSLRTSVSSPTASPATSPKVLLE